MIIGCGGLTQKPVSEILCNCLDDIQSSYTPDELDSMIGDCFQEAARVYPEMSDDLADELIQGLHHRCPKYYELLNSMVVQKMDIDTFISITENQCESLIGRYKMFTEDAGWENVISIEKNRKRYWSKGELVSDADLIWKSPCNYEATITEKYKQSNTPPYLGETYRVEFCSHINDTLVSRQEHNGVWIYYELVGPLKE